jgi:hypothetical protein
MNVKFVPGTRLFLGICLFWLSEETYAEGTSAMKYGADISFPMHKLNVSENYEDLPHNQNPSLYPAPDHFHDEPIQPLGNRQHVYREFMHGCARKYHRRPHDDACLAYEQDRIAMNLRQPRSMVNYTETVRKLLVFLRGRASVVARFTMSACFLT